MDPATIALIMQAIGQAGAIGNQPQQQSSQLANPEAFNSLLSSLQGQMGGAQSRTASLFGQNQSAIQNALGGNLGLSPEIMAMMGNRLNRQLDPAFAQSRDALRRSFNPRLAGSGAAGASFGQLLGQQSQSRALGQSGIQIQDAMARQQGQLAGLGQLGQFFGQQQGAQTSLQAILANLASTQTSQAVPGGGGGGGIDRAARKGFLGLVPWGISKLF